MHKRTKAVAIPPKVKKAVEERDSINGVPCCIFCGSPNARGEAHVIGRSQGGLGVEKNLVTVCRNCHGLMDNSTKSKYYVTKAKEYLQSIYPDWNEEELVYNKWKGFKCQ
jgi:5-methylcytosine-specific restriction endonuclease McrA